MTVSLLILLAAAAATTNTAPVPATRAEVAAQRAAIEQRFKQDTAECQQRFTVSSCVDEVRQRRHDALVPLVKREHELAAEERRARAAVQAQRVRERDVAAAQDEGERRQRIVAEPPPLPPATPASRAVRTISPEQAARQRQQAESKAEADAAKRREQLSAREERQRERIAAHEARQKRKTKPAAAPLPLPGASSAASAP